SSAVALANNFAYPQAFTLLRSALEHHLLDKLIFLADRFQTLTEPIDDRTWDDWQSARPSTVLDWRRQPNGRVQIVWHGVQAEAEPGSTALATLSIYYGWWQEFDPFAVPARDFDR